MNKTGYVINFADCKICTVYADELIIDEKNGGMVFFKLKDTIVNGVYMTKHHEIKRYNIVENKLLSISKFILEGNKVVEIIETV